MFVGTADNFMAPDGKLRDLLTELKIPCEFLTLEGVGHNRRACYEAFFDKIMAFHWKALKAEAAPASAPASARK